MSEILDVMYILEYLPEDQLNDAIIDDDVRDLKFIALMAASIKKFGPIIGELEEPEKWKTMAATKPKRSESWKKFSRWSVVFLKNGDMNFWGHGKWGVDRLMTSAIDCQCNYLTPSRKEVALRRLCTIPNFAPFLH